MKQPVYQADCDLVLEMEEAGVGVEEILQYARGVLSDAEVTRLIRGLERIIESPGAPRSEPENEMGDCDDVNEPEGFGKTILEPCVETRRYELI